MMSSRDDASVIRSLRVPLLSDSLPPSSLAPPTTTTTTTTITATSSPSTSTSTSVTASQLLHPIDDLELRHSHISTSQLTQSHNATTHAHAHARTRQTGFSASAPSTPPRSARREGASPSLSSGYAPLDPDDDDDGSTAPASRQMSLEQKELIGERGFSSIKVLTTIPFFDTLDLRSMRKLTKAFTRQTYAEGETIVQEGKSSSGFHVLVRGRVRVSARNQQGQQVELSILDKSAFFGNTGLVDHENIEPVTVECLENSIILSISTSDFIQFANDNPGIRVAVESTSTKIQLKEIPFFQDIPELKLQQLASMFELKRCGEGEIICRQGDEANGFYIIVQGRVSVSVNGVGDVVHLNTLSNGDWFGEIALTQNTLRTATLTTLQACTLLYLSTKRFNTFLTLAPEIRENGTFDAIISRRTANSLKAIPLFAFLQKKQIGPLKQFDEHKLGILGELFKFQNYPEGATIFKEGQRADAFYIICRGTVSVYCKTTMDEKQGESPSNVFLCDLNKNDWFGEIALVNNTRRTATVTTKTSCVLLKLASDDFRKFLQISPEISDTLNSVISVRTAQTLANIPFFKSVKENKPWSKLGILGSMFQFEHFTEGATVVKEGEIGDKFYVILDGAVEVSKIVHRSNGQRETIILEVLEKDCWFGEIALIKETIRLATVTCREDCLFLTVTKDKFNKFMSIAPDVISHFSSLVTHRTANMLRSIDFFHLNIKENKPWSKLELLCSMFSYDYFGQNEVVMREGELADASNKFYIIAVGSVKATRASSNSSSSTTSSSYSTFPDSLFSSTSPTPTQTYSSSTPSTSSPISSSQSGASIILHKGAFFGEISLLRKVPRTMTVTTCEPCVFFTLTREKFEQFLKVAPEVRSAIEMKYPDQVSGTRDEICELEQRAGGIDTVDESHRVPSSRPSHHREQSDDDDDEELSHLHISHGEDSRVSSSRNSPQQR